MPNLLARYRQLIEQRHYQEDPLQLAIVDQLQKNIDQWEMYLNRRKAAPLGRLINPPKIPPSVYIWGDVGRGKSFLMDCYFQTVPIKRKHRVHFHDFMFGIHGQMNQYRGKIENPLQQLAQRIAKQYRLICFDEFHINHISDAMLMYGLLSELLKANVALVMTSNYHPQNLYLNGINRHRFLPAIALIEKNFETIELNGKTDYRHQQMGFANNFFSPLNAQSAAALAGAFDRVEGVQIPPVLTVNGRELPAVAMKANALWMDFDVLCGDSRSPCGKNDYLAIAAQFKTIFIQNIPKLSESDAQAARRLTMLIDILYDQRVKLYLTSEVSCEHLYTDGFLANEFTRTVSRLIEMQTQSYMDAPKIDISHWV